MTKKLSRSKFRFPLSEPGKTRSISPRADAAEELTDAELIRNFLEHKTAWAIETFVLRHEKKVMTVCRTVCGNPHDAEDAFQSTMLTAIKNADRLTRVTAHDSWLCRVAYNFALKIRQRKYRNVSLPNGQFETDNTPDPVPETWQLIQRRETADTVIQELFRLPKQYQDCLILFYVDGLSRKQTARRTGKSVSAVKGILSRAKELLKSRLIRRGIGSAVAVACINSLTQTACASQSISNTVSQRILHLAGNGWKAAEYQAYTKAGSSASLIKILPAQTGIAIAMLIAAATFLAGIKFDSDKSDSSNDVALSAQHRGSNLIESGSFNADSQQNNAMSPQVKSLKSIIQKDKTQIQTVQKWIQHKREMIEATSSAEEAKLLSSIVDELISEAELLAKRIEDNQSHLTKLVEGSRGNK